MSPYIAGPGALGTNGRKGHGPNAIDAWGAGHAGEMGTV